MPRKLVGGLIQRSNPLNDEPQPFAGPTTDAVARIAAKYRFEPGDLGYPVFQTRDVGQFFRDRRPETHGPLTAL